MSIPKVSIIVPVYNVEKFLCRCIDSILAQTFQDFELLLIDDGTPDKSGVICDEYTKKDNRIRVFHKKNGGVSSARNLGLDNAKGEWITFVDADDWVKENYLKIFYDNSYCDLIICGHEKFGNSNTIQQLNQHEKVSIDSNLYTIWKEHLATNSFVYVYPWAKFYKNNIIQNHNIRFNTEMIYSEDFCFVLEYMSFIDEYKTLSSTDYQYYIEELRILRYKMDYTQYCKHLLYQNESIKKLESKCGISFMGIRENLGNRFFDNFINYLFTLDQKSYKEQRILYNRNIKNLRSLGMLPSSKRYIKFRFLFLLPNIIGFYILSYYKKRLWLK